ncbi:hypothetical protein EDC04DRAFT_2527457, partial [Pisolithus marmoratus]
ILRTCEAVISGSTALHLLLPECRTPWKPTDLDIYIPQHNLTLIQNRLKVEGYATIDEPAVNKVGYHYSHVSRVLVVSKDQRKIDIVVSRTATALSPIFQFHSTAVMNFVSADTIFCSYPTLTLHSLSMVNAGPLYYSRDKHGIIEGIRKYITRGF